MTADKPTHECNEYKFGIGVTARTCESYTAHEANTISNIIAPNIEACVIFKLRLLTKRKPRYIKIAEKKNKYHLSHDSSVFSRKR